MLKGDTELFPLTPLRAACSSGYQQCPEAAVLQMRARTFLPARSRSGPAGSTLRHLRPCEAGFAIQDR